MVRRDIKAALDLGVAPTILWGRETLHVQTDLGVWVTPAWLTIDRVLLELWHEWQASLCPGCGEPMASHEGKTVDDYRSLTITCPALQALENAQAAQAKADGHKDAKPNPSAARRWLFGTHDTIRAHVEWVKSLAKGGSDG